METIIEKSTTEIAKEFIDKMNEAVKTNSALSNEARVQIDFHNMSVDVVTEISKQVGENLFTPKIITPYYWCRKDFKNITVGFNSVVFKVEENFTPAN